MNKTAIDVAMQCAPAAMQSSNAGLFSEAKKSKNSSSGRFPPIENALSDIINNKRLEEAKRDA